MHSSAHVHAGHGLLSPALRWEHRHGQHFLDVQFLEIPDLPRERQEALQRHAAGVGAVRAPADLEGAVMGVDKLDAEATREPPGGSWELGRWCWREGPALVWRAGG